MPKWAVAVRWPSGELGLFWRVRRSPSGIYQVFCALQDEARIDGRAHDPHTSWHTDGRFHSKGYDRVWHRQRRQRLDAFTGAEPFISTSADQMLSAGLPICDFADFDEVLEIGRDVIDPAQGRQQLHLDLSEPGVAPFAHGLGERPVVRHVLQDDVPSIVVTLYALPARSLRPSL